MRTEIIKKSKKITWIEMRIEDLMILVFYLGFFGGCYLGIIIGLMF
jgi:hypothetical protein